jgi:glycosyltransferase involved in cell wall biosynthesis
MKILHIHQDYPDGRNYPSTKAVYNLIEACKAENKNVEHIVLSINRTSNPFKVSFKMFSEGYSLVYWALPIPYIYKPVIWFWVEYLEFMLKNVNFTMIHSHKLTTEGLFTKYLSRKRNVPYCVSIRGGSDLHNVTRLFDLKNDFSQIYYEAGHIFWVSSWAKSACSKYFSGLPKSYSDLPNICNINKVIKAQIINADRYSTVLSYHQLERKGLLPLLDAIAVLKAQGRFIFLDIIGGGHNEMRKKIIKKIDSLNLKEQVSILGEMKNNDLLIKLSHSKGMLLPAINETFGMTYVEAMAYQCPILYMANTGIDGYLDDVYPGVKLQDQTVKVIVAGLVELEENHVKIKVELCSMKKENYLDKFKDKQISNHYLTALIENISF